MHHQFKFSPVTSVTVQVHVWVRALPIVLSESCYMTSVQYSESAWVVVKLSDSEVTNVLEQGTTSSSKYKIQKNCIWVYSCSCVCPSTKCYVGHATEWLEYSWISLRSFGFKYCLYSNFQNLSVTIMDFNQVFCSIWQYFSQQEFFFQVWAPFASLIVTCILLVAVLA